MRRPVKDRRPFPSFKIVEAHCRCQCRGYYPPGASPIWLAAARPIEADYSPIMGIRGYGRLTGRCLPGSRFFEFPPKRERCFFLRSLPSLPPRDHLAFLSAFRESRGCQINSRDRRATITLCSSPSRHGIGIAITTEGTGAGAGEGKEAQNLKPEREENQKSIRHTRSLSCLSCHLSVCTTLVHRTYRYYRGIEDRDLSLLFPYRSFLVKKGHETSRRAITAGSFAICKSLSFASRLLKACRRSTIIHGIIRAKYPAPSRPAPLRSTPLHAGPSGSFSLNLAGISLSPNTQIIMKKAGALDIVFPVDRSPPSLSLSVICVCARARCIAGALQRDRPC